MSKKSHLPSYRRVLLDKVSEIILEISGVQLGEKQESMVNSRMRSRMGQLNISTEKGYLDYFYDNKKIETKKLLSLLTTHHTYFFREFSQFEFLRDIALKVLIDKVRKRADKKIRIWSSACSNGAEVYSLAMFLEYHLRELSVNDEISYKILGTDIDHESIDIANKGLYSVKSVKDIPINYLSGNWLKGKGKLSDYVRIKDFIKEKTHFEVMSLLDLDTKVLSEPFDLIWCRNVFIYFDSQTIVDVTRNLMKSLYDHGYCFVGLSESLTGVGLPLKAVNSSVYIKDLPDEKKVVKLNKDKRAIRVLCVDDSLAIQGIVKSLLELNGEFELVGGVHDGREAHNWLKNREADVMVLDIHMEGMGGVEYMKTYHDEAHIPVVIFSSVKVSDKSTSSEIMDLGATDFVEKPFSGNIVESIEELSNKLKMAYQNRKKREVLKPTSEFLYEKTLSTESLSTKNKVRILFAEKEDMSKISFLIKFWQKKVFAPLIICTTSLEEIENFDCHVIDSSPSKFENTVYLVNDKNLEKVIFKKSEISLMIFQSSTERVNSEVLKLPFHHLLVEEGLRKIIGQDVVATDVIPYTSFAYMSESLFIRDRNVDKGELKGES